MANLIQLLKVKIDEQKYNKPKYPIKKLYVCAIVKLTKRDHVGIGVWDNYYDRCKDFAIFYKVGDDKFVHIKSGQKLTIIDRAIVRDYCVLNPKPFFEEFVVEMRECKQINKSKVSEKFVNELETKVNMEINKNSDTIYHSELFGV